MEKCSLCNTDWKESTVYDSQGRCAAIVGTNLVLIEKYRGYAGGMLQIQQSALSINYCPMCGRNLEQEE